MTIFSKNLEISKEPVMSPDIYFIQKSDLVDGQTYEGRCRNSSRAIWRKEKNCFEYVRNKFGFTFIEEINAPEDFKGFDVFYARKAILT